MTQEEKARRYDEALERAKDFYKGYKQRDNQLYADDLETIFPELCESEDEMIRKELIGFLRNIPNSNYTCEEMADWVEKQGNQREQLINKACDVLVNCIEDYMLRRMEVWNEEDKKQTLENIRKKLEE